MSAIGVQTDFSRASLGGRYRLLRRIGAGGMGTVWEAEDKVLERRVAVKILAPALCDDETLAARFRREAQAAGRLTHPNIAQVFDYGEDDGCPYIVLELVTGSTLREVLERRGSLRPREVAEIGAQIADALAAAHAEGIVHRDVKPGNVMVTSDGRVKVMDFGIADALWFEPLTDTGTIMATAKYISPEQATGGGATGASDVYSLGAVMYELFAGRLPFDGDSPFAIAHAHAYEVPEPLAEAAPDVPAPMRAAVEWAMRKDARERPSAGDLAAAMRAAADDAVLPSGVDAAPPAPTVPLTPATTTDAGAPTHPTASSRAGVWVLAGIAVLALVLTLAFGVLDPQDARGPVTDRRSTPATTASQAPAPAPKAGGSASKPGKEPPGKALGHDEGGGPGNGHGPDG